MYRLSYSVFIFLLAFCYSQTNNSDIYFLDMGVAIEPKNGAEKAASLVNSKDGFLAQGPEEKCALSGRVTGFLVSMSGTLPDIRLSLGRGVPRIEIIDNPVFINSKNLVIGRDMKGLRSLAL